MYDTDIFDKVVALITKNRLLEAFELTLETAREVDKHIYQKTAVLLQRFNSFRDREINGLITGQEEKNGIVNSLFLVVRDLGEKENESEINELEKTIDDIKSENLSLREKIEGLSKGRSHNPTIDTQVSWDEYWYAINKIAEEVDNDLLVGGLRPQLLIGISRGGTAVTDHLSRVLRNVPFISLWAERDYSNDVKEVTYDPPINPYNNIDIGAIIEQRKINRILLVDDFIKLGGSMKGAYDFVTNKIYAAGVKDNVMIKTAVIAKEKVFDEHRIFDVDYWVYGDKKYLPYGRG